MYDFLKHVLFGLSWLLACFLVLLLYDRRTLRKHRLELKQMKEAHGTKNPF